MGIKRKNLDTKSSISLHPQSRNKRFYFQNLSHLGPVAKSGQTRQTQGIHLPSQESSGPSGSWVRIPPVPLFFFFFFNENNFYFFYGCWML